VLGRPTWSIARSVVAVGLGLQVLNQLRQILLVMHPANWLAGIARGDARTIGPTISMIVALGIIGPVLRGRRWALWLNLLVSIISVVTGALFTLPEFADPHPWAMWLVKLLLFTGGALSLSYGVIALREAYGGHLSSRGHSRQLGGLGAVIWFLVGVAVLGLAVSRKPVPTGALGEAPDAVIQVTLQNTRFVPDRLNLPVGKSTAILIVNKDDTAHSFDVDALNLHVGVNGKNAQLIVVTPTVAGSYELYCAVPGHKATGMTGQIIMK
jgi:plastocyanin